MEYNLERINRLVKQNPDALISDCDQRYERNIIRAAAAIAENIRYSRIVLLSGPSGSGKTTTAHNIEARLRRMGIESHTISLDDYYKDVDPLTTPRGANGEYDFESPDILDLPLLSQHFTDIDAGREVMIPHFDFPNQRRADHTKPLRLGANEVAIFEGIHALNGLLSRGGGLHATKVYISARSSYELNGRTVFQGTWMRILRRAVRDMQFRGTSPAETFAMWDNVRIGEKRFISPFKNTADVMFDSSFGYEVPVLCNFTDGLFDDIRPGIARYREILSMRENLKLFQPLDPTVVPQNAMIREFIGRS